MHLRLHAGERFSSELDLRIEALRSGGQRGFLWIDDLERAYLGI